jgi:hypothetical protein
VSKKLITEKLGVAEPTLPYITIVYEELKGKTIEFYNSDLSSYSEQIIITLKDMSFIYKEYFSLFVQFPVEKLIINFSAKKKNQKNQELLKVGVNYATMGAAYDIGKRNENVSYLKKSSSRLPKYVLEDIKNSLVLKSDFYIEIGNNFDDEQLKKLLKDLEDTIYHEFAHFYEYYKRLESGSKALDFTLAYVGSKNYNVPKPIFKLWNRFLYYIYFSEPYEMRAVTQEISNKLKRMSLSEFRDTPYGQVIQKMMDFDAEEDYQNILDEISNYNPNLETSILTRLYSWYLQDYFKDSSLTDKLPQKIIMKSKDIKTLMKKFQPRINKAGNDLNKKVLKFVAQYSKDPFGIDLDN